MACMSVLTKSCSNLVLCIYHDKKISVTQLQIILDLAIILYILGTHSKYFCSRVDNNYYNPNFNSSLNGD